MLNKDKGSWFESKMRLALTSERSTVDNIFLKQHGRWLKEVTPPKRWVDASTFLNGEFSSVFYSKNNGVFVAVKNKSLEVIFSNDGRSWYADSKCETPLTKLLETNGSGVDIVALESDTLGDRIVGSISEIHGNLLFHIQDSDEVHLLSPALGVLTKAKLPEPCHRMKFITGEGRIIGIPTVMHLGNLTPSDVFFNLGFDDTGFVAQKGQLPFKGIWLAVASDSVGSDRGLSVILAKGTSRGLIIDPTNTTGTELVTSEIDLGVAADWSSCASDDSVFVAVASDSDTVIRSHNGRFWVQSRGLRVAKWHAVTHAGNRWVAITEDSRLTQYSYDGVRWRPAMMTVHATWDSLAGHEHVFVAGSGLARNKISHINFGEFTLLSRHWTHNSDYYEVTDVPYAGGIVIPFGHKSLYTLSTVGELNEPTDIDSLFRITKRDDASSIPHQITLSIIDGVTGDDIHSWDKQISKIYVIQNFVECDGFVQFAVVGVETSGTRYIGLINYLPDNTFNIVLTTEKGEYEVSVGNPQATTLSYKDKKLTITRGMRDVVKHELDSRRYDDSSAEKSRVGVGLRYGVSEPGDVTDGVHPVEFYVVDHQTNEKLTTITKDVTYPLTGKLEVLGVQFVGPDVYFIVGEMDSDDSKVMKIHLYSRNKPKPIIITLADDETFTINKWNRQLAHFTETYMQKHGKLLTTEQGYPYYDIADTVRITIAYRNPDATFITYNITTGMHTFQKVTNHSNAINYGGQWQEFAVLVKNDGDGIVTYDTSLDVIDTRIDTADDLIINALARPDYHQFGPAYETHALVWTAVDNNT